MKRKADSSSRRGGSQEWMRQKISVLSGAVQHKGMNETMLIGDNGIRIRVTNKSSNVDATATAAPVPPKSHEDGQKQRPDGTSSGAIVAHAGSDSAVPVASNAVESVPSASGGGATFGGGTEQHAAAAAAAVQQMTDAPTTHDIFSFSHLYMSTTAIDSLAKIDCGDLVYLNGVTANAAAPNAKYPDWSVFLNVSGVDRLGNINLIDLYNHQATSQNLKSSRLEKCTKKFDVDDDYATRYDRSRRVVIDVTNPPDFEKAVDLGCIVTSQVDNDSAMWFAQKDTQSEKTMKAQITYTVQQWRGDYERARASDEIETIMVQAVMWPETLSLFSISDVDQWVKVGPNIFNALNYKLVGVIDVKGTQTNFGGINGSTEDGEYNFALALRADCLLADVAQAYRKIGIPVSRDWVSAHLGSARQTDPTFVPQSVTNMEEKPEVSAKILGCEGVEFRVLVGATIPPRLLKNISQFRESDGDKLLGAIANTQITDKEIEAMEPYVQELFNNLQRDYLPKYVFALSSRDAPAAEEAHRSKCIDRFMRGTLHETPVRIPRIEDGSGQSDLSEEALSQENGTRNANAPRVASGPEEDDGIGSGNAKKTGATKEAGTSHTSGASAREEETKGAHASDDEDLFGDDEEEEDEEEEEAPKTAKKRLRSNTDTEPKKHHKKARKEKHR